MTDTPQTISRLDKAIVKNSTQRDNAFLTLSSAAIGLGVTVHDKVLKSPHPELFKYGMVFFVLCILFILLSFFFTNHALHSQVKGVTADDMDKMEKNKTAAKKADLRSERCNFYAFICFFLGVVGLATYFFN